MRMKGKKMVIALMGSLVLFSSTLFVMPYEAYAMVNNSEAVMPMSDILVWKYKIENGILYKRQYNQSKDKWIGNWIRC